MSNKIGLFPILTILLASIVIISSQSLIVFADYNPDSVILSFDIDINTDPSINYGVPLGTFHGITSEPNTDKIYITVRDPDGERAMNILRVSDSNGYFDFKFDVGNPSVLSKEGTYTATAHIYNQAGETFDESEQSGTFIVTFENIFQQEPEPITVQDIDNDGIADSVDQCINQAETMNGYQDEDGCPDTAPLPDADSDGIADSVDQCINQAETVNGFEDSDGCPDTVFTPQPESNPQAETNSDYGDDLFLGRPVESGSTRYEGFAIGYRSYGVQIT